MAAIAYEPPSLCSVVERGRTRRPRVKDVGQDFTLCFHERNFQLGGRRRSGGDGQRLQVCGMSDYVSVTTPKTLYFSCVSIYYLKDRRPKEKYGLFHSDFPTR